MRRTEWLQETRRMRFEEAYGGWSGGRLTQEEAGTLLGVSERTFRRYVDRYEDSGLDGLIDRRLELAGKIVGFENPYSSSVTRTDCKILYILSIDPLIAYLQ